jgi:menaquinone-9 beta-reductase
LNEQALVVAGRTEFDGTLLEAARRAGAVIVPARVRKVRALAGGFELDTTAGPRRATVIVGADGANSLVRRTLASAFRRDQLSLATGFFAHGVSSGAIVIEFVSDPPGYIWSFPRPNHLAIGICTQADRSLNATALLDAASAWIRRTGIAAGARLERYSWPIPSLPAADLADLSPAGQGWYLIGDAAGLVDPITREGIYFALLSAQWAADAILSGAAAGPQIYSRRVREDIGTDLGRAARIKDLFFRPRFTRLLIDALQYSAGVRAVMADLVAGQQDYAGLKWRLLRTLRPGLAARLLFTSSRRQSGP